MKEIALPSSKLKVEMLAELSKYTKIPKDKEEDVLNFLFSAFFQVEVEDLQEVVEDLEAKRLEEFDRATDDAIRDKLETEGVV